MALWAKDLSSSISWIPKSHMAAEGENILERCPLFIQCEFSEFLTGLLLIIIKSQRNHTEVYINYKVFNPLGQASY